MGNQQERLKLRLAWLAGIIEGEGWISLCRIMSQQKNKKKTQSYTPVIGVCNCDTYIINEVKSIFAELKIKYRKNTRNKGKNKECMGYIVRKTIYEVSVATHDNVMRLAQTLLPYFIGQKKHRLTKLIEYISIRRSKPRSGPNSAHGEDEKRIYTEMYSYKGKSRFQNPQRLYAMSSTIS